MSNEPDISDTNKTAVSWWDKPLVITRREIAIAMMTWLTLDLVFMTVRHFL